MDRGGIAAKLGLICGTPAAPGKADPMCPKLPDLRKSLARLGFMPGLQLIFGLLRGLRPISAAA